MQKLVTNEWLRADGNKWIGREVLCRFNNGRKDVCIWNGIYWKTQDNRRIEETVARHITHFYIYEKDNKINLP